MGEDEFGVEPTVSNQGCQTIHVSASRAAAATERDVLVVGVDGCEPEPVLGVDPDGGENPARPQHRDRQLRGTPCAHRLHHRIGPTTTGGVTDDIDHGLLLVVEGHGPQPLGRTQPVRQSINGEQLLGPQVTCREDRHQPHRAAADDRVGARRCAAAQTERDFRPGALELTDPGRLGAEEAGGEDVPQQECRRVADAFGDLHQGAVGERNANQLGLRTMQTRAFVDPTEQLPLCAAAGQATPAVETTAAAGGERAEDDVAGSDGRHLGPYFDDFADELVPHHGAVIEPLLALVVGMQVGAADTGSADPDDDVSLGLDAGIGHGLERDPVFPLENNRLHHPPPFRPSTPGPSPVCVSGGRFLRVPRPVCSHLCLGRLFSSVPRPASPLNSVYPDGFLTGRAFFST